MYFPVLPLNDPAVNLEGDTFGLCDVDGLYVLAVSTFGFNGCRVVVARRCLVDCPSYRRNIDVNDFLGICIKDRCEIEGECVLAVVRVRSVVHQCLL